METAKIEQNSIIPKISAEAKSLPTRSRILLGYTDLSSPTVPIISNSHLNLSEQMPVLVKIKTGINIDTTKNEFPPAKTAPNITPTIVDAKNTLKASQSFKRSRKDSGHLIQSNKISHYFTKHNHQ